MADHEDEDLQMALQMSLQPTPEPKCSKPRGNSNPNSEDDEAHRRRKLMLTAAEKRMQAASAQNAYRNVQASPQRRQIAMAESSKPASPIKSASALQTDSFPGVGGKTLSSNEAEQLFQIVFGVLMQSIDHVC